MRRMSMAVLASVALLAASAWTQPPGHHQLPWAAKGGDLLSGVSATLSANAWAVGYFTGKNSLKQTLIERWNGGSWRQVHSPDPSPGYNELFAVSALSARDSWAVGIQAHGTSTSDCLITHWNGTKWAAVADAMHGQLENCRLESVTAISVNDVWAVGSYQKFVSSTELANVSLIEHWNGRSWQLVTHPDPGGDTNSSLTGLLGVAAVSARDVWAVGGYTTMIGRNEELALAEHWNGAKWVKAASPSPGLPQSGSGTFSVAAKSASVWAVGDTSLAGPYVLRLVGGRLRAATGAVIRRKFNSLDAVAVTSATSVWAVGSSATSFSSQQQPWIVHWNGSQWIAVPVPHPGGHLFTRLVAVTAPSAKATWAVGTIGHSILNDDPVTLIEHWTGKKWVRVTSPNPHA